MFKYKVGDSVYYKDAFGRSWSGLIEGRKIDTVSGRKIRLYRIKGIWRNEKSIIKKLKVNSMSKLAGLKQTTKELIDLINDYKNGSVSYGMKPFDSNHWFERMFRLYIDGSYSYPGNEPGYKFVERLRSNVKDLMKLKSESSYKKLRSLAISLFLDLLSVEFTDISRSTIQKTLVKHFTPKELELLNHHLVDDLVETYGSVEDLGLKDHKDPNDTGVPKKFGTYSDDQYKIDQIEVAENTHDWQYPMSIKFQGVNDSSKWLAIDNSELRKIKNIFLKQIGK